MEFGCWFRGVRCFRSGLGCFNAPVSVLTVDSAFDDAPPLGVVSLNKCF